VLNYMAMALPVVAYDNPVHVEYLAESGVYVPLGDEAAFAEAIQALSADPTRGRQLGEQLRARAIAEYSWQAAACRIVATYERLG
jgi:glycosyltransferase involved in cell wall biosynthesis